MARKGTRDAEPDLCLDRPVSLSDPRAVRLALRTELFPEVAERDLAARARELDRCGELGIERRHPGPG